MALELFFHFRRRLNGFYLAGLQGDRLQFLPTEAFAAQLEHRNTGAALLTLWVKCVSAERGHGSKSRVHFLGYSLVKMWVNCLTHAVPHIGWRSAALPPTASSCPMGTRKCPDRFKEYRRGGFAPSPIFLMFFFYSHHLCHEISHRLCGLVLLLPCCVCVGSQGEYNRKRLL